MLGEGSAYRTVAKLWRIYFHSPADTHDNSWYQERHKRQTSKLIDEAPALGRSCEYRPRKLRTVE